MIEPGPTMIESGQTMRSNAIALARGFPFARTILVLGYLAGFVLLDWISVIEPYGPFEITP